MTYELSHNQELLLQSFSDHMHSLQYRERTISETLLVIKNFIRDNDPSQITRDSILSYASRYDPVVQRTRYTFVKGACVKFAEFLSDEGIINGFSFTETTITQEHLLLNEFITDECNLNSDITIGRKRKVISTFLSSVLTDNLNINDISIDVISDYLSDKTIEDKRYLQNFFRFLYMSKKTDRDLSQCVYISKRPKKLPSVYSEMEIRQMIDSVEVSSDSFHRDRFILLIAARTGLRSCDIANLKLNQFTIAKDHIEILQQKTGKLVRIKLSEDIIHHATCYIRIERPNIESPFLLLRKNAPFKEISSNTIRHVMYKAISSAHIETNGRKRGPHTLRASLASAMINNNVSYVEVAELLGHSDTLSLCSYTRVDIEKLRKCALTPIDPCGIFKELIGGF